MLKHFRVPGRLGLKLTEFGVSIPAVLRRAGLPQDLFEQKRVLVSTDELFALWAAIGSVSSDPLIGLRLAVETRTLRELCRRCEAYGPVQKTDGARGNNFTTLMGLNSASGSDGCFLWMPNRRCSRITASPGCSPLFGMAPEDNG